MPPVEGLLPVGLPSGIASSTLSSMTQNSEKVRENRLRRMAARQGLTLVKSRRRDCRALDFGTYGLVDSYSNYLAVGDPNTGYGLGLDDVESALNDD